MVSPELLKDIRLIVTRTPIPPGQITLYKALNEAGYRWVSKSELATTMRWGDDKSLDGVLGALGNRANQTEGTATEPGIDLLIEKKIINDELHYRILPEFRTVIKSLPKLRDAMKLSVDEIHAKYHDESKSGFAADL